MKHFVFLIIILSLTSLAQARDSKADALARVTVQAMGGQQAYDNTRYLTWRFFGGRRHVWDKYTGDVRFEDDGGLVVIMNMNTRKGRAWKNSQEITTEKALQNALKLGYESWINDSYWLVMPYKLQDPGVNLIYSGEGATDDGRAADVLTLTFNAVGVTPENKYEVFIDRESKLVTQWKFYSKASDSNARFTSPWKNWKRYGEILLSDNRGNSGHTEVAVLETVPETTFTSPVPLPRLSP